MNAALHPSMTRLRDDATAMLPSLGRRLPTRLAAVSLALTGAVGCQARNGDRSTEVPAPTATVARTAATTTTATASTASTAAATTATFGAAAAPSARAPATQPPPAPLTVRVEPADIADLQARALSVPVQGVRPVALTDTFGDGRSAGAHEALDIAAPMRTPVFAVEDGVVAKLFTSQRGGLTVYQFDPGARFAYYYAHLDAYAPGLREGQPLERCALIGYVGLTGNSPAGAPHLHFAIFKLEADKRWWRGAPVNPHPVLRATRAAPCPPAAGR